MAKGKIWFSPDNMEGGIIEAPVMDLTRSETPATASAAEVGMEKNDHNALHHGDNLADGLQQEIEERDPCIDEPKSIAVTVSSSSPCRVDAPGIPHGTPDVSDTSMESLCPVTCVNAVMSTEEVPVTVENTLEQPISLSKTINEDAPKDAPESTGLGKQLYEEVKVNHDEEFCDASEAIHQDNASGSCEEGSNTLAESKDLGPSSSQNETPDDNVENAAALSSEIVDEDGNGVGVAALSLQIVDEELCPQSSETENLDKNLEFLVRDDSPGGKDEEDKSKVVHEGVTELQDDALKVSQDGSNILESKNAGAPETQETISILEGEVSPSEDSGLYPQILGPVTDEESKCGDGKSNEDEVRKSDGAPLPEVCVEAEKEALSLLAFQPTDSIDASNVSTSSERYESGIENKASKADAADTVRVMEGAKTIEFVCEQYMIGAQTTGGYESVPKQSSHLPETEVDGRKGWIGTAAEQALNKPFNKAGEVELERDVAFMALKRPIDGIDDEEVLECVHGGTGLNYAVMNESNDACSLKEFQESEGNRAIGEAPFLAAKQAIKVGPEDYPVVKPCKAGNGAASSEEQCQQGFSHDKDGGSSMDSTAGSGWKLCGTDGQVALQDGDNSGSEDSASSPAGIQPQQRKKRLDLQHQFVREIVKIQHDREQFDRELFERPIQAPRAASSAESGAKATEIQKSSLVGKRQLRNDLGKNFMHRRLSEREPDSHVKDSQQTHGVGSKKVAPVHAKGVSTQFKENAYEGDGAENSLEGNQQGKFGQNKYNRLMPIYRPPSVRDSFAPGANVQNNTEDSELSYLQSASFIVSSSPDSSTSSVSEPYIPPIGSAKRGKDKGTLRIVKSSSGERYVHYAGSQAEQSKVEGMGIKVTFDTENHQRHIEFSEVDPPRQQKLIERMDPSSFDHGHDSHVGFGLGRMLDTNPAFSHSSQASFSSLFGSSPPVAQGKFTSSETLSSGKGKHSQRAKRGHLSQTIVPMKPDVVSHPTLRTKADTALPFNQFQLTVDKGFYGSFEGKHRFSEQADIPVTMQKSSSWLQETPLIPVHFSSSSGASMHDSRGGKSRHAEERSGGGVHSYSQDPGTAIFPKDGTLEHFWSNSNRRKLSTDGGVGEPLSRWNFQIPQVSISSSERTHNAVNGKLNVTAADWGKEKDSKTKTRTKDYRSPYSTKVEDSNLSQSMSGSHPRQASGISQAGLDTKGAHQSEIQVCEDNQVNLQENLVSENCSRAENSEKGSTLISQPHVSPLSVDDGALHTTRLLGKWGDIVDDSPDAYDYLQMKVEVGNEGIVEGSQSGAHYYEYNSPGNSNSTGTTSSSIEKSMSKDLSKHRGLKKNGLSYSDKQKNKAGAEAVQNILAHSANETPARKSVFQRLGPQNVFGGSILGRPPQVLDEKDVVRAIPNVFPSGTFDFNRSRNFEVDIPGSAQALHGVHLSSRLHDSHYDAELCANIYDECTEVMVQANKDAKQRRSKRELYVPRRGL